MKKTLAILTSACVLAISSVAADANATLKTYKVVEDCKTKEKVTVQEAFFVYDSKKAPGMIIAFKKQKDAQEFALKNGGKVQQLDLLKDKVVVSCDDNITRVK